MSKLENITIWLAGILIVLLTYGFLCAHVPRIFIFVGILVALILIEYGLNYINTVTVDGNGIRMRSKMFVSWECIWSDIQDVDYIGGIGAFGPKVFIVHLNNGGTHKFGIRLNPKASREIKGAIQKHNLMNSSMGKM